MKFISSVLRIIEAGQEGNQEKLKRYSFKLAQEFRNTGQEQFARCIEEKFDADSNVIIQDNL